MLRFVNLSSLLQYCVLNNNTAVGNRWDVRPFHPLGQPPVRCNEPRPSQERRGRAALRASRGQQWWCDDGFHLHGDAARPRLRGDSLARRGRQQQQQQRLGRTSGGQPKAAATRRGRAVGRGVTGAAPRRGLVRVLMRHHLLPRGCRPPGRNSGARRDPPIGIRVCACIVHRSLLFVILDAVCVCV